MGAPVLVGRKIDADCGCPEEEWEGFGLTITMHLAAGRRSNVHADAGDEGEWQAEVFADTIDGARIAAFAWAQSIWSAEA